MKSDSGETNDKLVSGTGFKKDGACILEKSDSGDENDKGVELIIFKNEFETGALVFVI